MKYCSQTKKNEQLIYVRIGININQAGKKKPDKKMSTYYMIPYIQNSKYPNYLIG